MLKNIWNRSEQYFYSNVLLLIILIVSSIFYLSILSFNFLTWDDNALIYENVYTINFGIDTLKYFFNNERFTFIPFSIFSLLYSIVGKSAFAFHFLNYIFHLINIFLVYKVLKLVIKNDKISILTTLLFAFHPLAIEPVSWASALKDIIFSFFTLLSIYCYIRYYKEKRVIFYAMFGIFTLFAAYSKIQGLLVPIILMLIYLFLNQKLDKKIIPLVLLMIMILSSSKWIFVLFILLFFSFPYFENKITSIFFKTNKQLQYKQILLLSIIFFFGIFIILFLLKIPLWSDIVSQKYSFDFYDRTLLAGKSMLLYLINILWPLNLNAVYPYPSRLPNGRLDISFYYLIFLIFIFVVSILIFLKRNKSDKDRIIFLGWFFFLVNISVFLHFLSIEGKVIIADRYIYLGRIGIFIIIAFYVEKFSKKYFLAISCIVTFCLLLISYNQMMNWKNSKSLYQSILKSNPNIAFINSNLAVEYLSENKIDSAIYYHSNAIRFDPTDASYLINRANIYLKISQLDSALNDFFKAIKLDTLKIYKHIIYAGIGDCYLKMNKDTTAWAYYSKSIAEDSLYYYPYGKRGFCYLKARKINRALRDFYQCLKLNKKDYETWNYLGELYYSLNNKKRAIKYFSISLGINPYYDIALKNRAYTCFLLNENEKSIADYSTLILLNNRNIEAYFNRGWQYAILKKYKEAYNDYDFILKLDSTNFDARINRAYASYYLNNFNEAFADFKKNVEIYPQNPFSWQHLGWFFMQQKNYQKAKECFIKSIELNPTVINSYLNIAWIDYFERNYSNSFNECIAALNINRSNKDAYFLMANIFIKQRKTIQAIKLFEIAYKLGKSEALDSLKKYKNI
ncbi:MAG: tetratricopeptide repeat protein [Bacteroidales bacterium]|nr:tetratricopeptide repeat protein [Bacteroidales bacterium]